MKPYPDERGPTVLHPAFIASLLLLLLNDFYLKQAYGNTLTGKISDFAGLIVFPVFFAALVPAAKKWVTAVTAVLFIAWKTPLSTPLINFINQHAVFTITRVVDYTDYWALFILPVTQKIIASGKETAVGKNSWSHYRITGTVHRIVKISLVTVAFFAICATSMRRIAENPKGTVYIGEQFTIRKSKKETIERIKSLGYNADFHKITGDSTVMRSNAIGIKKSYYQTDNIIIFDENTRPIDTILNVKYTLREKSPNETVINIINVTLSEDRNIQRWQALRHLHRQYKKLIKKVVIDKVKN